MKNMDWLPNDGAGRLGCQVGQARRPAPRASGARVRYFLLTLLALPLALTGCQREEEIVHYRVPRVESAPAAKIDKSEPVRFLGAILPQKDDVWFLKLLGPEAAVTPLEEPFQNFVKSIRFPEKGDAPITWDLPADWTQIPGNGLRYATIKIKSDAEPLELSVTKLPGEAKEAGSVLANVNRWRGQVGLDPIQDADLPKETKTLDVAGVKATLVNMVGKGGGQAMPPFAKAGAGGPKFTAPRAAAEDKLNVDLPAGWTEEKPASSITLKQYVAGKDVRVTITTMGGDGGGLALNLNRWRGQIKLPKAGDKELFDLTKFVDLPAGKAIAVDMENSKETGTPRIVGMILLRPDATWFLKMTGPSEQVAREKANFETFAKSLRLGER